MTEKENLKIIYNAIADKKGERIKILDISEISPIADYFIITNGNNKNQVQAIADNVNDEMLKLGIHPERVEGFNTAGWILMDYNNVVVHIFSKDDRFFYDLERIWSDGRTIDAEEL